MELSYLYNGGFEQGVHVALSRRLGYETATGCNWGDNFYVGYATLENSGDSYITESSPNTSSDLAVSPEPVFSDVSGYLATMVPRLRYLYNAGLQQGRSMAYRPQAGYANGMTRFKYKRQRTLRKKHGDGNLF